VLPLYVPSTAGVFGLRFSDLESFPLMHHYPFFARRPLGIGHPDPTSMTDPSAQPALMQPLDQSQENALPWVPGQHPVNQPTSTPHDLARHLDESRAETMRTPSAIGFASQPRASLRAEVIRAPAGRSQAFRLQAKLAITIYAQLLTRSSTRRRQWHARRSLSWAIKSIF